MLAGLGVLAALARALARWRVHTRSSRAVLAGYAIASGLGGSYGLALLVSRSLDHGLPVPGAERLFLLFLFYAMWWPLGIGWWLLASLSGRHIG